jgi:hypothetical protein
MTDPKGQVLNTLVRMVVPIRREFGHSLDIKHFLHDLDYRQEIISQALQSQDPRLRDYAQYVHKLMAGPRTGADAPPQVQRGRGGTKPAPPASAPPPFVEGAPGTSEGSSTPVEPRSKEDELRDQIMRKYTKGLR